jgi:hypothetical protein
MAALLSAVVVSGVSAAPAGKFDPLKFYGSWNGQWKNVTSGDTGDAAATVRFERRRLTITLDLFGDPLGCGDPPVGSVTLRPRSGRNGWTRHGFRAHKSKSAGFGNASARYDHQSGKLTVKGSPPCDKKRDFALQGKLTKSKLRLNGKLGGQSVRLRLVRN